MDDVIAEESTDGKGGWVVRLIHHTMYQHGEVDTPSTVMCWCDEEDFAKSIAQSVKLVMGMRGECEV